MDVAKMPAAWQKEGKEYPPLVNCVKYGGIYLCRGVVAGTSSGSLWGQCGLCKEASGGCKTFARPQGPAYIDAEANVWLKHAALLEKLIYDRQMSKDDAVQIGARIVQMEKYEMCHGRAGEDQQVRSDEGDVCECKHALVHHPEFFADLERAPDVPDDE
jgi:hypothetical protein